MQTMETFNPNVHLNSSALVKSIVQKMMYTCDDPYCKHRAVSCTCDYASRCNCNCRAAYSHAYVNQGPQYQSRYINDNQFINRATKRNNSISRIYDSPQNKQRQQIRQCCCQPNLENPEQDSYTQRRSRQKSRGRSSSNKMVCSDCHNVLPAGNYPREESRGRWINNSLHSGCKMRDIIYQSQNPRGRIKKSIFSKNYDTQYQMYEDRVQRTRAPTPGVQSKIAAIVRRDRERNNR